MSMAAVLGASSGAARGAEDAPPTLVLESGAHTGPIRRLAVNADETIVVTASDDKSARLWDVASGNAIATLHPPVGAGPIGRLYGAAISPTGVLALGGTTAAEGDSHRIHRFDLRSHASVGSFDARGGDIKRLEWSPDGALLAAAYAGKPAVRVFDPGGSLVYEEFFKGDAYYVTFSSTGRMAVSASDGSVHLYSTEAGRVTADGVIRVALADPRGINFSPDGRLLAVGYLSRTSADRVQLDVFDVSTRRSVRTLLFSDVPRGNLMNVAWQSDGKALYAGGTGYSGADRFIVKRIAWPDATARDIDVGTNSVLDLLALRDGRMLFATAEPAWGVLRGGAVIKAVTPPTARFAEASILQLNDDAAEVSWSYRSGEAPVHVRLAERRIGDGRGGAQRATEASHPMLRVTDGENRFDPKVNGKRIALEPSEVSRAAVTLPDGSGLLLGSSRALRNVDANGRQRWASLVSTEIRAIGISTNGKVAVTAMLDGTIRWWRVADGALLMSLFATTDRRWIVWTETGFFDVGPGAEELLGWLVNRPEGDRADYFPLSRFRGKYLRPDVIDRVLASGDVATALASANRQRQTLAAAAAPAVRQRIESLVAAEPVPDALPPVVTLRSPARVESSAAQIAIGYSVTSRSAVTAVTVRVDGRPHDAFTNRLTATPDGADGALLLQVPRHDAQIQIFAASQAGISTPATVHFRYEARESVRFESAAADARPRLFVLGIGVSRYRNTKYDLQFAAKDADDFTRVLLRQEGRLYRSVDVVLLSDEQATRAKVREALKWLANVTTATDVGILYIAGHGMNDIDDVYYFLPHDADATDLAGTSVSEDDLRDALVAMGGRSIFFIDTCYSGRAVGALATPDVTRLSNRFSSPEYGVIVFSASYRGQESVESRLWSNGAFTMALVEGLSGQADYRHEGQVTYKGLDYFVSDHVRKLTSGLQTPVTTVPVGLPDFALAQVLDDKK
jgi:WD40 repeat protein